MTALCAFAGLTVAALAAKAEIQVDADFPSGNILVQSIEGDTVTLRQDRRDTEVWWFYWCFRVRGAEGRTLQFNFTDGDPIGVRGPAVSLDEGASWSWLGPQPKPATFTYTFPTNVGAVRFSFGMPYTEANLNTFLSRVGSHPALKREVLCQSRKGRDVERLRVGKIKGEPKARVLITCRAHACEMMTSYAAEGLIEAFLAKDKDGKWLRKNVELLLIPFVDKDGVEDGDQGKNRRPRDHNRDYDANSLYPETRTLQQFVPKWSDGKLRLMIDLHCPVIRGPYNEFIYLVGSPNPAIAEQQQRFGEVLERVQTGPLMYNVTNNLPYGQKWNTGKNFTEGMSGAGWAVGLPGIKLATTIELPYATASGKEVNAESARAFGRDLARAMRRYLED